MERMFTNALLEIGYGYRMSRCLHAAVELGVADAIENDAESPQNLAAKLHCDAESLRRLLMTLVSGGVFDFRDGRFTHTPASRTLRSDHPESVAGFIRFTGGDYQWQAWCNLAEAVRSGKGAFEATHGCDIFEFYRSHPDEARAFDQAMTAAGQINIAAVVGALDLPNGGVVADIGGGRGHLLRGILDASPGAKGILFDLPDVTANAVAQSDSRIDFIAGDFFKDDMPAADSYLFMRILHDWDDTSCIKMLRNLRRSISRDSRVLVLESIISDDLDSTFGRLSDMTMLVLAEGRERTTAEYAALFHQGGFLLAQPPISADPPMSILIAVPE